MESTSAPSTPTPGTTPRPRLSRDGSVHVTDERINTITHLAASCFALVGGGLLVVPAVTASAVWKMVGLGVYAASVLLLFVASTLHHGIDRGPRVNGVLRTLDYASVFVLIAGTTTPMVLVLFRNAYGWAVLGAVWVVAAVCIALRSALRELPKYVTNTLYITMGWMPVLLVGAGVTLPVGAYVLLAAGGLVYCVGFVVFVVERPNPLPGVLGFHEIWHVLVVLAAVLHYLLMYRYVLPA